MNDNKPKARWRWFRRLVVWPLLGFVLLVLALVIYFRTDSFQARVHGRLISALEQMTGGRVELGKFNVVPFRFRVEVHDLTIHGTEAPGEIRTRCLRRDSCGVARPFHSVGAARVAAVG